MRKASIETGGAAPASYRRHLPHSLLQRAALLVALVVIGGLLPGVPQVRAQSFFDQLFGISAPAPTRPAVSHRTRVEPIRDGDDRSRPRSTGYGGSTSDDRGGGKLQTLCVRTCDGYYWPLSYPVPRRDIGKEAALCRASCDVEAKLYVRSGPGADIEDMKDLDGNAYTESPTALLYRKRLVDGCSCKPMPWTSTELARHDTYRSI